MTERISTPPRTFDAFFASTDQNETIDNLYSLCAELEEKIQEAESCLACAEIFDPIEIIRNTLEILYDSSTPTNHWLT